MVGSEKITCGKLAKLLAEKLRGAGEGAALPSYRAIAKEYGVSLSVCQRAVRQTDPCRSRASGPLDRQSPSPAWHENHSAGRRRGDGNMKYEV